MASTAPIGFRLDDDDDDKYTKAIRTLEISKARNRVCVRISCAAAIVLSMVAFFAIAMVLVFYYHYQEKHSVLDRMMTDARANWHQCDSMVDWGAWSEARKRTFHHSCMESENVMKSIRPVHDSAMYALRKVGEYFLLSHYIQCDQECWMLVRRSWESIAPFIGWSVILLLVITLLVVWGICIPFQRRKEYESQLALMRAQQMAGTEGKANGYHHALAMKANLEDSLDKYKAQLQAANNSQQ